MEKAAEEEPEGNAYNLPLVGTFYAAPAEDAELCKSWRQVEKGQTLRNRGSNETDE